MMKTCKGSGLTLTSTQMATHLLSHYSSSIGQVDKTDERAKDREIPCQ